MMKNDDDYDDSGEGGGGGDNSGRISSAVTYLFTHWLNSLLVSSNQHSYTNNIKNKSQKQSTKSKREKRENAVIVIMVCTVKTTKQFVSKCYRENSFRSSPFIFKTLKRDLKL
jgi:hypothetical protein